MCEGTARTANELVLPVANVQRDASSYVDPHGFVFHHDGEVYRYIHPGAAPLYERLLNEGVLDQLQCRGLVPTRRATFSLEGVPKGLVLHHKRIEPLSYCVEWCPSMLRDAGLATLDLVLAALRHGLMLQDAYPWNVLFDGSKAVFVDLTSIVPPDPAVIWPAHEQFEAFFFRPLALASQGYGDVARGLLYNNITGIGLDTFYRLTSTTYHLRHPGLCFAHWLDRRLQRSTALKTKLRKMAERVASSITPEVRTRFLNRLTRRLKAFSFRVDGDPWANYYDEISDKFDKQAKVQTIRTLLERLAPETVLDVGCNTGVFSIVAAKCGTRVTSVDSSESCIELLYATAKKDSLPITPLISDVLCPTPSYGFMSQQYPSLWQRTASDVVLCLGLMHHLHLTGRQSLERIVELVSTVTNRHLIFEFVGMNDANIERLPERREINYTLETVATTLKSRFENVQVHPSDRETRRLLVCRK